MSDLDPFAVLDRPIYAPMPERSVRRDDPFSTKDIEWLVRRISWMPDTWLEPFRPEWPKGYVTATPLMLSAFVLLPDVQRYCGRVEPDDKANTGRLQAALAEFGPICCAIPALTRAEIVDVSLSGDVGRAQALHARLVAAGTESAGD